MGMIGEVRETLNPEWGMEYMVWGMEYMVWVWNIWFGMGMIGEVRLWALGFGVHV